MSSSSWTKYAQVYDPIKCGSIDGIESLVPHDKGIIRAINSTYKPNARVKGNPDHTLFVGHLHVKTTEKTLKKIFREFGKIRDLRLVRDIVTGMSKCYAFIEFKRYSSAKEAFRKMRSFVIDDCEIVVQFECERTLKGWKPRRLGGGFGGNRNSGQLRFGGISRPFLSPNEAEPFRENKRKHKKIRKK